MLTVFAIPKPFAGEIAVIQRNALGSWTRLSPRREILLAGDGAGVAEAIADRARPPIFGLAMYRALAGPRVTLNIHIDIAGPWASNMRLFEATGVGACLLTERQRNLPDLFEPDAEVVTCESADEAVEKVRWLAAHEEARRRIAAAGQRRAHQGARLRASGPGSRRDHPGSPPVTPLHGPLTRPDGRRPAPGRRGARHRDRRRVRRGGASAP